MLDAGGQQQPFNVLFTHSHPKRQHSDHVDSIDVYCSLRLSFTPRRVPDWPVKLASAERLRPISTKRLFVRGAIRLG